MRVTTDFTAQGLRPLRRMHASVGEELHFERQGKQTVVVSVLGIQGKHTIINIVGAEILNAIPEDGVKQVEGMPDTVRKVRSNTSLNLGDGLGLLVRRENSYKATILPLAPVGRERDFYVRGPLRQNTENNA